MALVLNERPVHKIEQLLTKYPHLTILTTMTPYLFNNDRVFFLNGRRRDLNINCFVNYLWDVRHRINHIDIKIGYNTSIDLRTEAMEALSVIAMLIVFDVSKLTVHMSSNNDGCHMSCYERSENFTASCYITRKSPSTFFEEITVFTTDGRRYTLNGGDVGAHSYAERYGAAWQTILEETLKDKKRTYQQNIEQLILKVKGASTGVFGNRDPYRGRG